MSRRMDNQGHCLMQYPFETTVPLDKKVWVGIAQNILRQEKLTGVDAVLEPGKWYDSREDRFPIISYLLNNFFPFGPSFAEAFEPLLVKHSDCLGTHIVYSTKRKKTYEVIHLATGRDDKEILTTLLHEVAHALHIGDNHGKKWEAEYLRLMNDYHTSRPAGEVYEALEMYESTSV